LQDWLQERFEQLRSKGDATVLFEQSQTIEPTGTTTGPISPIREEFAGVTSFILQSPTITSTT